MFSAMIASFRSDEAPLALLIARLIDRQIADSPG